MIELIGQNNITGFHLMIGDIAIDATTDYYGYDEDLNHGYIDMLMGNDEVDRQFVIDFQMRNNRRNHTDSEHPFSKNGLIQRMPHITEQPVLFVYLGFSFL